MTFGHSGVPIFYRNGMEIRWVGCWALEKGEQYLEVVFNIFDFVISKLLLLDFLGSLIYTTYIFY